MAGMINSDATENPQLKERQSDIGTAYSTFPQTYTYLKTGPLLAVLVDIFEEGLNFIVGPHPTLEGVHLAKAVAVDALDRAVGQGAGDLHPRPLAVLLVVDLLAAQMAGGDVVRIAVLGDGPTDRLGLVLAELARHQRLRGLPVVALGPAVAFGATVRTRGRRGGGNGIGIRLTAVLMVVIGGAGGILGMVVAHGSGGGRSGGDRLGRLVSGSNISFVRHDDGAGWMLLSTD